MILPGRSNRVAQDQFQGVGRWANIDIRVEKAGAIFIIVFQGMAGDMLAPNNALAVNPIARKRQAGDAITFCGDQLAGLVKAQGNDKEMNVEIEIAEEKVLSIKNYYVRRVVLDKIDEVKNLFVS